MSEGARITDDDANFGIEQFHFFKNYLEEEDKKHIQLTLKSAEAVVRNLMTQLNDAGINTEEVYLRLETKSKATVLLLVHEDAFFSDDFELAYQIAKEIREMSKGDFFDIHFSFAAKTDDTFEHNISCEGFYLKRKVNNERSGQDPTRTA